MFNRIYHNPNGEDYRTLVELVASDPAYDPWSPDLEAMTKFTNIHLGQPLTFRYLECIPNLLLSPQFHFDTMNVDSSQNAVDNAGCDCQMAWALIESIVKTGDGTQGDPYLVLPPR